MSSQWTRNSHLPHICSCVITITFLLIQFEAAAIPDAHTVELIMIYVPIVTQQQDTSELQLINFH